VRCSNGKINRKGRKDAQKKSQKPIRHDNDMARNPQPDNACQAMPAGINHFVGFVDFVAISGFAFARLCVAVKVAQ
jgi:hypothetical protein